jgi:predicted nucleotidyltransferase
MKAPESPPPVAPMGRPRPDPELIEAFGRAVRRKFAEQAAREQAESEARRRAILPIVRQAVADARDQQVCGRAWLFGSYAWGQPGVRSDVDILAEDCPDSILLASIVGRACQLDVHVIEAESAPSSLRDRAMKEGLPL